MPSIQIISAKEFINKISLNRLHPIQTNRSIAYLRAKQIVFYDNWSGEHCLIVADLDRNKPIVIEALKASLNH